MIGHSTVLIEAAGKRILTDPFFSPYGNPAYARVHAPARSREELAGIDMVLISHNHFDHVDPKFNFSACFRHRFRSSLRLQARG